MSRQALVVGINRYDSLTPLRLCAADAQAIASVLERLGGFKVERLPERILDARPVVDSGGRVSKAELEAAILRLFLPAGGPAPDTALLFIAGHGLQVVRGVAEGYLTASDTAANGERGIPLGWLRRVLRESANRAGPGAVRNQIVWLDTCHSGALLDFTELDPGTPNRCLIAAARAYASAYEEIVSNHGVLTAALLAGLDPTRAEGGVVTNLGLADTVEKRLRRETQQPLFQNAGEAIELTRALAPAPASVAGPSPDGRPPRNPYKGLRYFDRDGEDPGDFFGRTRLTNNLLERLRRPDPLLAVLGVSGSGKSSAVRAGLLHRLRQGGHIGGSADWPQVIMRPGPQPLASLAYALEDQAGATPDQTRILRETPTPARLATFIESITTPLPHHPSSLIPHTSVRLILLIDQFEEIFTESDPKARDAFLACLLPALDLCAGPGGPRLTAIITLRADFYGKCAEQDYQGLARRIQSNLVTVLPMDAEELREAILGPARRVGGEVDEALATRLIAEVQDEPGHLPLLQDTLTELWQQAEAGTETAVPRLGLALYRAKDGLAGALSRRATRFYETGLSAEERTAARWVLIQLTRFGVDTGDTRRRLPIAALANPRYPLSLIGRTVARLAGPEARLLVTGALTARAPGESGPQDEPAAALLPGTVATVEVAHEALIRHWGLLCKWLKDEREFETWRRRLDSEAVEWRAGRREPMIGAELAVALEQRERAAGLLGTDADAFLHASIEAREAAERAERERLEAEQRQELERVEERRRVERERQRTRLRWTGIVAGVSLLGLVVAALLGWSFLAARDHARTAEQQAKVQLFESRLTHAALLAGNQIEDYEQARRVLAETVPLDATIPSGRRHARNLLAGYADLMGARADRVYRGAGAQLMDVDVSPDGRWIVAGGERGALVVFDAEHDDAPVRRLEGHDLRNGIGGVLNAVRFAPDGKRLYSAGADRRILRWSVPDWQRIGDAWETPDAVWALALSPDGKTLASGLPGKGIALWSTETERHEGQQVRTLADSFGFISFGHTLAISQNGQWIMGGDAQGRLGLWELAGDAQRIQAQRNASSISAVSFGQSGPNDHWLGWDPAPGGWIATGNAEGLVRILDFKSGRPRLDLRGHRNVILDLQPSADGTRLWSASRDGTMRLWDVRTGRTLRVYQGHAGGLWAVAAHDHRLFTAASDGTVRGWSAATTDQWVWDVGGQPSSAAISPDGTSVLVGFRDGALRGYALPARGDALTDARLPERRFEQTDAHGEAILRIAFSPDGRTLATASGDHSARLWRFDPARSAPEPLRTIDWHTNMVHAVTFSPDGYTLATASYDGEVGLHDLETGARRTFAAHEPGSNGGVASVAFAPDGRSLLTAGYGDARLRLWDLTRAPPDAREIARCGDALLWAAMSPDGTQAAAVGRNQSVQIYDLTDPTAPATAGAPPGPASLAGHEQTVFRASYTADGAQLATVGGDMTVRLWDLRTSRPLFVLRLPAEPGADSPPLWDFDFHCPQPTGAAGTTRPNPPTDPAYCWIAVPLTMGRLVLYRLPYADPPESIRQPQPDPPAAPIPGTAARD